MSTLRGLAGRVRIAHACVRVCGALGSYITKPTLRPAKSALSCVYPMLGYTHIDDGELPMELHTEEDVDYLLSLRELEILLNDDKGVHSSQLHLCVHT